jgi:hypothetical protein
MEEQKSVPGFCAAKGLVVDISKSKAMKKVKCSGGNWSIASNCAWFSSQYKINLSFVHEGLECKRCWKASKPAITEQ